jgi:hypothetical protein
VLASLNEKRAVTDVSGVVTAVIRVFGFLAFSNPLVLAAMEIGYRVKPPESP